MRDAAVALSPVFGVPVGSISRICTSPRVIGRWLDASWYNKDLAGVEGDGAVLQFDVERALEHKEKIVRVLVLIPVE
jgi:hypothetical protein